MNETALDLVDRIKREADSLQDKSKSVHETYLEICKLTQRLSKKLICVSEKIGERGAKQ